MKKNKLGLIIWCVFLVCALVLNIGATVYAMSWDRALTGYFGTVGGTEIAAVETQDYSTIEELLAAEKDAELQIVAEGTVLLQNDNGALPLSKGDKVSVFGQTAQMWMTKERITGTKDTVFLESLESAGLEINASLRKFYKQSKHTDWGIGANLGNGGVAGTWQLDEVPQSEYTDELKSSYADYSDAAIVVISRGGSEGGDLPRYMGRYGGSDSDSYLDLTPEEKDLFASVMASGFKKTVLIMHTTNAMNMKDIAAYGFDAIIWVSGTGEDGVEVMGKLLTGEYNPSGRTVDTFVYDNFNAPAMQNFGDFRFTENGALVAATTTTVGGTYSYLNYGEGIYVGYKYYETRYEDAVLGQGNTAGYDYAADVAFPFGHGLSYTTFDWTDYTVSAPDEDGNMTISLKVTNTGSNAGKDVVEVYYQAPYTDYDRENGVEKASVNLFDFAKTKLLAPGESENITLKVNANDMKSYDAKGAKTYILEAGDYYITAARDAHDAVEKILAAKSGSEALTHKYTLSELKTLSTAVTGNEITNLFDDAVLPDAVYLSRADWSVLDNGGIRYADGTMAADSQTMDEKGTVYTHEVDPAILAVLKSEGWAVAGNPKSMDDSSWEAVSYGEKNGLTLSDLSGKDYDDEAWDKLLNQMTQAEQTELAGKSGWGNDAVSSIGKAKSFFMDGPQGMIDYVSGGVGYQFTDANLLAATWNKELGRLFGDLVSQEFTLKGASIWWAPAVNIHRTAFSGRNFEYYGEDGTFSGIFAREVVLAAKRNGLNCQIKHFFLNDQEFNRGANGRLAPFAAEQAIREIYLKAFELPLKAVPSAGVMLSMARIGARIAPGSWAVCTGILRNEWGMTGAIITDAQSLTTAEAEQALAAGCDLVCTTQSTVYSAEALTSKGGQYKLRESVKHYLFMEANATASSLEISEGFPVYIILLIAFNALAVIYLGYVTLEIVRAGGANILPGKQIWVLRIILWAIGGVILALLLFKFFTEWLPMLSFALQTI
ncbi:MAG: glycoside hydrolase family 3 C-terminal domain-containing protein [Oscillospiraceae bacterium]|nr:glycoside hydrolase family 3 C-terminal domain-containing protein [Oscillospiraceae bacterium]